MDQESWSEARLIPTSGINGAEEQERRRSTATRCPPKTGPSTPTLQRRRMLETPAVAPGRPLRILDRTPPMALGWMSPARATGPGKIGDVQLEPTYPVTTDRLVLRPLTHGDLDGLLSYRGLPEVCRYLPFAPMTTEVLQTRLDGDLSRRGITAEGQALTLGVQTRETGQLLGDVVLFFHSLEHASGEIGYVFHPDAGGHGYATEACAALLRLAVEELRLHRVIARLDSRNEASACLASRLGMRQEAHLVRNQMFKGAWADELVFAMLAEEWPSSPAHALDRADRS